MNVTRKQERLLLNRPHRAACSGALLAMSGRYAERIWHGGSAAKEGFARGFQEMNVISL